MTRRMRRVLCACALAGLAGAAPASAASLATVAWRAPTYSLTARAMDVRTALESFGVAQGVPVLCSQAVGGAFSGNFKDVPAADFLDRVTAMHNLVWYFDGTTIFVSAASESTSTLIDLRYMKAGEVSATLKELGVEDPRFPLKTASNDELILVYGPPRYVTLVAETIMKADRLREQRTFTEIETRLFPLQHTWADNVSLQASSPEANVSIRGVAYLLQEIMQAETGAGKVREGTNAVETAEATTTRAGVSPVIRAENRLNAVLVRDVATRMNMYERLIRALDIPQKLVEIEVTTLELSRNDSLDWQLSLKVSGSRGEFEGAAGQNVANLADAASISGTGLAGAASYLGRHVDVSASLSALREKGKARNISRTTILTMNNLAASMTDTQSYHAKVVGTEVASLEEVSAGTRLEIKPRVVEPPADKTNEARRVWLTMSLQDGGFESITVDAMPMTRTSTLDTQALVPENGSLLLAGYFRDIEEEAGWGIPYLRDIPWIGWLFGGASHTKESVQRLFIITPRVIGVVEPGLTEAQAVRARDVVREEDLQEALEGSDDERRVREADRREYREIRKENADERLKVREAEIERDRRDRKLEMRKRDDALRDNVRQWKDDYTAREEAYEKAREAQLEAREAAQEAAEKAREAAKEEAKP